MDDLYFDADQSVFQLEEKLTGVEFKLIPTPRPGTRSVFGLRHHVDFDGRLVLSLINEEERRGRRIPDRD